MIKLKVSEEIISKAKKQISEFKKIEQGQYRYTNVEAWRGIVCEFLTSDWIQKYFYVDKVAKGLDNSGLVDDCDMIINKKKVEIKSATKNYFKYLMPKIYDVENKPKDIYIGVKYNETVKPNEVLILGYIKHSDILKYPIKKNKGASYYEIPLNDLIPLTRNTKIKL